MSLMESVSHPSTLYPHVERIHITVNLFETFNLKLLICLESECLCLRKLGNHVGGPKKSAVCLRCCMEARPSAAASADRVSGHG